MLRRIIIPPPARRLQRPPATPQAPASTWTGSFAVQPHPVDRPPPSRATPRLHLWKLPPADASPIRTDPTVTCMIGSSVAYPGFFNPDSGLTPPTPLPPITSFPAPDELRVQYARRSAEEMALRMYTYGMWRGYGDSADRNSCGGWWIAGFGAGRGNPREDLTRLFSHPDDAVNNDLPIAQANRPPPWNSMLPFWTGPDGGTEPPRGLFSLYMSKGVEYVRVWAVAFAQRLRELCDHYEPPDGSPAVQLCYPRRLLLDVEEGPDIRLFHQRLYDPVSGHWTLLADIRNHVEARLPSGISTSRWTTELVHRGPDGRPQTLAQWWAELTQRGEWNGSYDLGLDNWSLLDAPDHGTNPLSRLTYEFIRVAREACAYAVERALIEPMRAEFPAITWGNFEDGVPPDPTAPADRLGRSGSRFCAMDYSAPLVNYRDESKPKSAPDKMTLSQRLADADAWVTSYSPTRPIIPWIPGPTRPEILKEGFGDESTLTAIFVHLWRAHGIVEFALWQDGNYGPGHEQSGENSDPDAAYRAWQAFLRAVEAESIGARPARIDDAVIHRMLASLLNAEEIAGGVRLMGEPKSRERGDGLGAVFRVRSLRISPADRQGTAGEADVAEARVEIAVDTPDTSTDASAYAVAHAVARLVRVIDQAVVLDPATGHEIHFSRVEREFVDAATDDEAFREAVVYAACRVVRTIGDSLETHPS